MLNQYLLSNLFDNAIEASEELFVDQRRMILKMQHDDCGFIISIRNRLNERSVINKYSGNYAVEGRQGWF